MSYEDRGNKKWIPFLMPEHKGLLKRYYKEVHHLKFEDTKGPIDGTIENALNNAIFSGDIVTVMADASFRRLRREARLCAGAGPPHQTKSRR